jgi:hypothetical protein
LQVLTFNTREAAMAYINENGVCLTIEPEKGYDPDDPNADDEGNVWVIAVTTRTDSDRLYMCSNGCIR